jgi:energy-coupling factor transporter ATP-binding protein EcfA2
MLIDEVLAVGDASFSQKCMDVFYTRRNEGKTIVLVTHDMATVQSLCHRAMVLHDGALEYVGDPEDAALRYYRLNFAHETIDEDAVKPPFDEGVAVEINGRTVHAQLLGQDGEPIVNVEQGRPIALDVVIEAARDLAEPAFLINVVNAEHVTVFGFLRTLDQPLSTGQRVRLRGEIENRLVPGRYYLDVWIRRNRQTGDVGLQCERLLQFVVYGTETPNGVVSLRTDVTPTVEP